MLVAAMGVAATGGGVAMPEGGPGAREVVVMAQGWEVCTLGVSAACPAGCTYGAASARSRDASPCSTPCAIARA